MTDKREYAISARPVTVTSAIPTGNATTISNWLQVMSWERFMGPMPVDLQIDVRLPTSAGGGFPEVYANNFCAGGYYDAGGPFAWDDSADGCVALKIELGAGSNPRTLYADCRGGRYSLGSNNFVRVSVARWLAAGSGSDAVVQAGISPSDGSGEYLTYSAVIDAVAAAGSAVLAVPPGAAWWDFYGTDGSSWSAVSMDTAASWVARRFQSATPGSSVYDPPTSPMPLLGSNGIVLTNQGAAAAGVTACFWIR